MAKSGGKEPDELEMLKATMLAKELEVITVINKMRRLEDRSISMENSMEKLSTQSREKIDTLTDIINFLTNEGNNKDNTITQLEKDLAKAEQTVKDTIARMNKEMDDMKNAHEFQLNSMKLQLEAAMVKLREVHEFALRKKAIEEENTALKEQLLREQSDHAEAISDVERVSVQEKERLKKEIQTRVEGTKREMTKSMGEQLHSKTKKTIVENEQLRKEVAYHTTQTEILVQQNEKLLQDLAAANRALQLAKELEEDLARRNHMYQKTTRILVFKLREKQMAASDVSKKTEQEKKNDEELRELWKTTERLKTPQAPDYQAVKLQKGPLDAKNVVRDEAVKFLFTCLEDIELERLAEAPLDSIISSGEPTPRNRPNMGLAEFSVKQRQDLVKALLRQAVALRSLTSNIAKDHSPRSDWTAGGRLAPKGNMKTKVRVDDILAMPIEKMVEETRHQSAP